MRLFSMQNLAIAFTRRRGLRGSVASRPPLRKVTLHLEMLEDRRLPSGLIGNLVVFGDSLSDTGNDEPPGQRVPVEPPPGPNTLPIRALVIPGATPIRLPLTARPKIVPAQWVP